MDALAESTCSSSSLSSRIPPWKYHVFLSFRGEDTRKGFTAHLHAALQRKGIITFIDDELQRGDVISLQLLQSIEDSLISLVILSQNYASSTWCLDELPKILESKKSLGREVIPVFYNMDPSHVRHQREAFADAFRKHSERFWADKEKVQRWRDALKEVANLSGYHCKDQLETKLIEGIVASVWTKLQPRLLCYKTKFVGMESKMEAVDSILKIGLNDIRLLGIWGMGGVGKTSLARAIYETNCNQFDIYHFFADVRDVCEQKGLVHLQRKFLSRYGKFRSMEFDDAYEGVKLMRSILWNQKVFMVLDDVSEMNQLEYLVVKQAWLGPGSRVIVTARDKQLMTAYGEFETYEAKLLSHEESFQLFCQRAFKSDHKPTEIFLELSKSIVELAAGLPLTIEVLGCHLCGRNIIEWKDALEKFKEVPPNDILKRLRISYDALDDMEKNIFLDIACFFKGMAKDEVIRILEMCGFHPTIGIKRLVEKSLLVEDNHGWLGMHDILQEMGKTIVLEESPKDAGRRSRLWSKEDIDHVLTKNKGTNLIEVIGLQSPVQYEGNWAPEAFSMMCNLRILTISWDVCLPLGLKCLPSSLKVLEWEKYPFKSLPLGVHLNELVDLRMHHSKIIQLWNVTQMLEKIKFIDLSYSSSLIHTPDFSMLPNLEQLILESCIKLVKVHPSLGHLKKIVVVNMRNCKTLKALPSRLEMDSLRKLILSGCSSLKKLPEFGEGMKDLSKLNLKDCKNLVCLPCSIGNLKSLKILNTMGCSKLSSLPNNLDQNESIEELDVSGTSIREIPSSIVSLKCLRKLYANGCSGFTADSSWGLLSPILTVIGFNSYEPPKSLKLPPSMSSLTSLKELNLRNCNLNVGSIPNDFGSLPSLEVLDLSENNFGNLPVGQCVFPPSFSCLSSLNKLYLEGCKLSDGSLPDDLNSLSSLRVLDLSRNNFTNLPYGFVSNLLALKRLCLNHCNGLSSLPDVPTNVRSLDAVCCHPSMELLSFPVVLSKFLSNWLSNKEDFDTWMCFPGSEVPSWFHNQSLDFLDNEIIDELYWGHAVSVKVDISRFCGSSKRWGIALCFVLQDMVPASSINPSNSLWIGYGLNNNPYIAWPFDFDGSSPHLFILFLSKWKVFNASNQVTVDFLADRKNSLHPACRKVKEANTEGRSPILIRKYGWRVTSEEEIEEWRRTMSECNSRFNEESEEENATDLRHKKRRRYTTGE